MSRRVLRGEVHVDLPPEQAIHLFTPVGERDWVADWLPHFPDGEIGDGSETGTVFTTPGTIWVVAERGPNFVRYARVMPNERAGLVHVRCRSDGAGGTRAEVMYDLTPLSGPGAADLDAFAASFEDFLAEWERLIAAATA
jgi:hypothetical protein